MPGVRRGAAAAAVLVVVGGGAAVAGTRATLAEGGSGRDGWRITATWLPGHACVTRAHRDGEGGACGLAGRADEAVVLPVTAGDEVRLFVTGATGLDADVVRVTSADGSVRAAQPQRAGLMRFFAVEVDDGPGTVRLDVLDDGRVVDTAELPPPPATAPRPPTVAPPG